MFDFDNDGDSDIWGFFIIFQWIAETLGHILGFAFSSLFGAILTIMLLVSALFIWYIT